MALGKRRVTQLFAGMSLLGLLLVSAPATACIGSHHGGMGGMMGSASRLPQDPVVAQSDRVTVEIKHDDFLPRDLSVRVGAEITWVNRDGVPHDATSDKGGWSTGLLKQDEQASLLVEEPGTFDYLCTIHPDMKAKLVVRPDAAVQDRRQAVRAGLSAGVASGGVE